MREASNYERLSELRDVVTIYGPINISNRCGIIAFNIKGLDSNIVGSLLDGYGVAVRTGKHCTHPLHQRLKIEGTVRASLYIYNNQRRNRLPNYNIKRNSYNNIK